MHSDGATRIRKPIILSPSSSHQTPLNPYPIAVSYTARFPKHMHKHTNSTHSLARSLHSLPSPRAVTLTCPTPPSLKKKGKEKEKTPFPRPIPPFQLHPLRLSTATTSALELTEPNHSHTPPSALSSKSANPHTHTTPSPNHLDRKRACRTKSEPAENVSGSVLFEMSLCDRGWVYKDLSARPEGRRMTGHVI